MQAREKNIIESTSIISYDILIVIMSRTIRKYQIRDRGNSYKRIEKRRLEDRYYTDVAKSHERDIRKKGLDDPANDDQRSSN